VTNELAIESFPSFAVYVYLDQRFFRLTLSPSIVNGTAHKYEGAKTFEGLYEFVNTTSAAFFEAKAKAKAEKRAAKEA
jgi:hypothetical protein